MLPVGIFRIYDPDDGRLTSYRNVPDAELLARRGLFVAEGRLVVTRLLQQTRLPAESVMVTPAALVPLKPALVPFEDLPVYVVPQELMNGITGFNVHRGCLALGRRTSFPGCDALTATSRRLVALERIGNADNVGSVFRSASAFGMDGVLLEIGCTDPLYRKAIRTSMGAALTMSFAIAEPWPGVLHRLRDDGWAVVAMTPASHTTALREVAASIAGRRVVIVVGHEGEGLSSAALDACTHHARIPMANGVDSLNVATATAIGLYELQKV